MYDKDEVRRARQLRVAEARVAKARDELAHQQREARAAKSRLVSTTKHENWHARRLSHLDRLAGYDGEMASARIYVRSLSWRDYVEALRPYAEIMPNSNNLEIEIAAVRDNFASWHERGETIVLDREVAAAASDRESWERWQREHPGSDDWRKKTMSRRQWFLISRTVDILEIEMPGRLTRGEAAEWLNQHGANLRLHPMPDKSIDNTLISDVGVESEQ
jgi:hypothetical protein